MKVLIVKCNRMLTKEMLIAEQKRIAKELHEDRVVLLDSCFYYEVVDVDDVDFQTSESYKPDTYKRLSFRTRIGAEQVLQDMKSLLDSYGVVTIADYYKLAGVDGNYLDAERGWTTLTTARCYYSTKDRCWYIGLPNPTYF